MADTPQKSSSQQNAAPDLGGDLLLDQAALDAMFAAAMQEEQASKAGGSNAGNEATPLTESDIDSLLMENDLDKPLVEHDIDRVLVRPESAELAATENIDPEAPPVIPDGPSAEPEQGDMLTQEALDALLAGATEAALQPPAEPEQVETLSQEALDALFAEVSAEASRPASAPEQVEMLTQEALDALLAEADSASDKRPSAPRPEPVEQRAQARPVLLAEETPGPAPQPRKQGRLARYVAGNMLRTFASLSVGVVVALGLYYFLYTHPFREAGFSVTALPAAEGSAHAEAGHESAENATAPHEAEGTHAEESKESKTEESGEKEAKEAKPEHYGREYEDIAASYRANVQKPEAARMRRLRARIDDFVSNSPSHPKAVEVLLWKARLYTLEHNPYAARETYRVILSHYGDSPDLDSALLAAAETANQVGMFQEAMSYAQRLLTNYADSHRIEEGQVALADAYRGTGKLDDARAIYERIAGGETGTRAQAGALTGLAHLAMDQRRYTEAIPKLEARVALTAQPDHLEEAKLLLAQAYHGASRLAEARESLNGLIKDHPEAPEVRDALVELSRVLDDMGSRDEGLQVARQATERFPKDARVLHNEGELLALGGKNREAGDLLMSAERAGLNDPQVVIEAARNYNLGKAFPESRKAYEYLLSHSPRTPQAFLARLELAGLLFHNGQQKEGIHRLEQMVTTVKEPPQRLPVLIALSGMYEELGLPERAAELSKEIATASNEPGVLAQAAVALIEGGAREEGIALASHLDRSKLNEKDACSLLSAQGQALVTTEPAKAAGLLEEAYTKFPQERAPDLSSKLVRAYLAADEAPKAEVLLSSLEEDARMNQVDVPKLRAAAISVGDYLYDKKEYPRAAEAYRRSLFGDDGKAPEYVWAKYQRANSLLQTGDFDGSAPLYDEVAKTSSLWAREAGVKAEYARTQKRVNGQQTAKKSS